MCIECLRLFGQIICKCLKSLVLNFIYLIFFQCKSTFYRQFFSRKFFDRIEIDLVYSNLIFDAFYIHYQFYRRSSHILKNKAFEHKDQKIFSFGNMFFLTPFFNFLHFYKCFFDLFMHSIAWTNFTFSTTMYIGSFQILVYQSMSEEHKLQRTAPYSCRYI